MLFKAKNKTYFIERNEQSWVLARTSSATSPLVIERLVEIPLADEPALKNELLELQGGRVTGNYVNAVCGVFPLRRVLRRVSVDLKKAKDPAYINELCVQQLRIEPEKYSLALVTANEGRMQDIGHVAEKELLICGMPSEDVIAVQDGLLQSGIYPVALEIGSVAILGAVSDYLRHSKAKSPVLLLEIGNDTTLSYIVSPGGVEATRPISFGIESMLPIVQKKLGLKDEESARKLFYSNTFDFASMGTELVQRLLKELQSSIGFFEVQTGQSISQLACALLPEKLGWIDTSIGAALGLSCLKPDLKSWLESHRITLSEQVESSGLTMRQIGILSLLVSHQTVSSHAAAPEKKD